MESTPEITPQRQEQYMELIDRLLKCPNGQEPEVLDASSDLLDPGFVQTLMRTASYFAHHDNPDTAKFLIFLARELAHQMGLYTPPPETSEGSA